MTTAHQLLILIAAIAVSVGIGSCIFSHVDTQLIRELKPYSPEQVQFAAIIGCSVLSIIAFLIGHQLKGKVRVFGAIQIWVLAMLISYLGRDALSTVPLPISFLSSIALGMLAATSAEKWRDESDKTKSSHFVDHLQNTALLQARLELIKQDEVDRRMLAADLHDQVLNDLKTLRQSINNLKELSEETTTHLDGLVSLSMSGVREVMDNLSPVDIEHLGLSESLRSYIERVGEKAGIAVSFESPAGEALDEQLSKIEATLLYRLMQESTNNILKHAGAQKIMGQVKVEDGNLVVRVVDDGKGISPEIFSSESRGMNYMRLRADLIGATIAWKPRKSGSGTIVEIRFQRELRTSI